MGRTSTALNEVNLEFVEFAARCGKPVLDIGAAFGVASKAALASGASVIANDLDPAQLATIASGCSAAEAARLVTLPGRFPAELDFEPESLGAVHAANLLNFLRGDQIEAGIAKIFGWLAPGGKVFTISGTPYAANVAGFIATYEARREAGNRWPGECESLSKYSSDPTLSELPEFLHLLDDTVLTRTFRSAGFDVEYAEMFHRRNTPSYIKLDGRENVKVVAKKPS